MSIGVWDSPVYLVRETGSLWGRSVDRLGTMPQVQVELQAGRIMGLRQWRIASVCLVLGRGQAGMEANKTASCAAGCTYH